MNELGTVLAMRRDEQFKLNGVNGDREKKRIGTVQTDDNQNLNEMFRRKSTSKEQFDGK